jgi:hypothetical protein
MNVHLGLLVFYYDIDFMFFLTVEFKKKFKNIYYLAMLTIISALYTIFIIYLIQSQFYTIIMCILFYIIIKIENLFTIFYVPSTNICIGVLFRVGSHGDDDVYLEYYSGKGFHINYSCLHGLRKIHKLVQ